MNHRMIGFVIGKILLTEASLLLLPMLVAVLYGESVEPFLIPALLLVLCGLMLGAQKPRRTALYARDGLAVVALAWIVMSLFGALPFTISGDIPGFVDAFFETVSGFTTTGASILTEVESLSKGILFWRSLTHWVGGMGVLVFVMAVLPMTDGHGMHLLRAEVPGPTVGKLVSRMSDSAKILYGIYFVMTVVEIVLLLAGGMSLFDACIHSFGSAGTGGFSCRNLSIGAYDNAYFDIVIGVFMLLFGINFNLYYFLLIRRFRDVFRSEELRTYLLVVAASVVAIACNIDQIYNAFGTSLRHAFFQVSSIITTTGYATVDFNTWPAFSKTILVLLMFIGACAGSTGGGIKIARIVILAKTSLCDMRQMLHPNAVATVRMEGKPLRDPQIRSVHLFLTVYLLVFAGSCLLLSLEGMDLITTFTAVASCVNNIGPGLEIVGPMGNFSSFSNPAKLLLAFDMLAGRLELFPMLLLFAPSIWKRKLGQKKQIQTLS
ncbi:trk system potassium uptake protein TrkH [Oscillibacter sp. PC13]|uniref:TrkH family potassium uptake protein n=1 Tax=Oscillibacter sp. PC13 TaxID=1855299 RepID=UPI0008DFAC48|nr:TrkH family potassium uptake protein [Oscillibacter sp. PC13]SFO96133.1 trk system potassium uptake protein TrkH [Oscillibacter sp. PC13]